jgi:hypothetical protein
LLVEAGTRTAWLSSGDGLAVSAETVTVFVQVADLQLDRPERAVGRSPARHGSLGGLLGFLAAGRHDLDALGGRGAGRLLAS